MLANYDVLLFDIDDTLLDFEYAQKQAFPKLLDYYGLGFSQEEYLRFHELNQYFWHQFELGNLPKAEILTRRFTDFFKPMGLEVDGAFCDDLYRHYLTEGNQLFPGAKKLIDQVAKTHQIAIITNGVEKTQRTRLDNNGLTPYFKHVFISETMGCQKPDTMFFEKVFTDMQISPEKNRILVIGDSLQADILGGQRAGVDTCWINPKGLINSLDKEPTYTIQSLLELL